MSDAKSDRRGTNQPALGRRRFLTGIAAGAGLAPFVPWSRLLGAAQPAPATDLCYGNAAAKAVLSSSDFAYLGAFKLPSAVSSQMAFSAACLTGRRLNGELRLLLSGPFSRVIELSYPGQSLTRSALPVASQLNFWSDIFGSKAL